MNKFNPYSMSRLTEYERCPQKFWFKYVQKLPEIQDNAGFRGQVIHKAIATALSGGDWEDILSELELDDIDNARYMVDSAVRYSKQLGRIVGIETKFAIDEGGNLVEWFNSDGFVRGIIDLITEDSQGNWMIWDWKTGHTKPTKFQIFLYAWAVQKALKRTISKVGYILLGSSDILEFDVSEEELKITERKLNKLIKTLENDDKFEPTPGTHCAYCSYVSICPLASEVGVKDIPSIRNESEAAELARKIQVMHEQLKRYEKILKGFVEQRPSGIIRVNDKLKYGLKYSEVAKLKKDVDLNSMYQNLWEQTDDPTKVFKVSNSILKEKFPNSFTITHRKSFGFIEKGDD